MANAAMRLSLESNIVVTSLLITEVDINDEVMNDRSVPCSVEGRLRFPTSPPPTLVKPVTIGIWKWLASWTRSGGGDES